MTELQFNGVHLALVDIALLLGFALGTAQGWILRGERKEASDATR